MFWPAGITLSTLRDSLWPYSEVPRLFEAELIGRTYRAQLALGHFRRGWREPNERSGKLERLDLRSGSSFLFSIHLLIWSLKRRAKRCGPLKVLEPGETPHSDRAKLALGYYFPLVCCRQRPAETLRYRTFAAAGLTGALVIRW